MTANTRASIGSRWQNFALKVTHPFRKRRLQQISIEVTQP